MTSVISGTMTSFGGGEEKDTPCEVRFLDSGIVVSYGDEELGIVRYTGDERGAGHYKLTSPEIKGRATLHRFEGESILEGYWIENRDQGMWRIYLDDEE